MILVLSFALALSTIYIFYLKRKILKKDMVNENLFKDFFLASYRASWYDEKYNNEFDKEKKIKIVDLEDIIENEKNNFEIVD